MRILAGIAAIWLIGDIIARVLLEVNMTKFNRRAEITIWVCMIWLYAPWIICVIGFISLLIGYALGYV